MVWRILPNRLLLFVLLATVCLAAAFYLILNSRVNKSTTQQVLNGQLLIARAGKSNLDTFFQAIGNSVALRARTSSVERGDATTEDALDKFVDQWGESGLVSGVVLTDSKGIVTFNANIQGTHDLGESLADRDYFIWAKNQKSEGEYFIGMPVASKLGASKGQTIVPVASPVFANGVFIGVLTAAVKLQPLTQRFLELMKVSDQTRVYLLDQSGSFIYRTPGSEEISDKIKEVRNETTGGQFQEENLLVAYSPFFIGNLDLVLIVISQDQTVPGLTSSFRIQEAGLLILLSLITVALGVIYRSQTQNRL